jgi:hypothetical protein
VNLVDNQSQPWNAWDPVWYLAHNYSELRYDDRRILELMADFLADARMHGWERGIDVGTGTNLYPALAMLPFCQKITMIERTAANLTWLQSEVRDYAQTWDPFWGTLVERQPAHYKAIGDPRDRLDSLVDVRRGNIFTLERDAYEIGTMFFVAESITARRFEFEKAAHRFLASLRRNAPFVAAFMKNSQGYRVGRYEYAAVAVEEEDVWRCLAPRTHGVEISTIPAGPNPLRHGYDGFVLATGYAGRARRNLHCVGGGG